MTDTTKKIAMVDEHGRFHCPAGHTHDRGPLNGIDVYRCFQCGSHYRVTGVARIRARPQVDARSPVNESETLT